MLEKDQDTVKLLSINPASKRHGSVWGEKKEALCALPRQSSPDTAPNNSSAVVISPGRLSVADEIKLKRREAAKWISALTEEPVPFASDKEFRAALRSGVLLCRIMNEVAPGTIKSVHAGDDVNNTKQRYENVQNFMSAAIAMGVPTEYMLSMPDLESDSSDERPRVADCILWLRRLHGGSASSPSPLAGSGASGALLGESAGTPGGGAAGPAADSPRRSAHAAVMRALQRSAAAGSGGSPAVGTGHGGAAPHSRGGTPAHMMHTTSDQISALQGMSALLKEKMSYTTTTTTTSSSSAAFGADVRGSTGGGRHGGSSYGLAVDAMGPVLENVLGNLTQEYERRLLSKDQEIQSVKDKLHAVQREMDALHASMSTLRLELESAQAQAAVEAEASSGQRVAELEQRQGELQARLDAREEECAELRERLALREGAEDEARRHMELELEGARARLQRFDQVAERYKQVQEENRRLYNTVQDLRGAIRVFCRVRPCGTTGDPHESCVDMGSDQELGTYDPAKPHVQPRAYRFDRVFGAGATQEDIYADTQPLIRSVLDGYNVCIFAYGQTGSGKTHTMTGTDVRAPEGRGINYRALDDLFHLRDERSGEVDYSIQVTMLEIYNESLRDLLVDNAGSSTNRLDILNTQSSGLNVRNITKIDVSTTDDVMDMMARGARNRHSAETKMNQRSSRSHQVLTVIVSGQSRVTGVRTHACLHLVDLAGSERTSKSEVTGERLVEANHINTSLTSLGSVMAALAAKSKHVPFRDSKLTQLLADSLSGQAKVMMFVHVSPESSSYQETTSTLKFAERVSCITLGEAKRNADSGEVYKSHEEISRLQSALQGREEDVARLAEALRQAEARNQALAARLAGAGDSADVDVSALLFSGGSLSAAAESRLPPASTGFAGFQSPAPTGGSQQLLRSSLPASPAMFGSAAGTPVMQTIREADSLPMGAHAASASSALPAPPSLLQPPASYLQQAQPATPGSYAGSPAPPPASNVTPVSARSSGVHASRGAGGYASGGAGRQAGSASMRESSRWGGGGGGTPTVPTPSPLHHREHSAGAALGRPPAARPPMHSSASASRISTDAGAPSSSLPRTSSLPPARSPSLPGGHASSLPPARSPSLPGPPASSLPRPSSSSSAGSMATASARPGTTWQRSSSSSGAAALAGAGSAAAAQATVPASAGGQRSGKWGGSSSSSFGGSSKRWN